MMKHVGLGKILVVVLLNVFATAASAQYFQSRPGNTQRIVLKATQHDSVIVNRSTPFDLPAVKDTTELTYHEPLPDSIMPRSAVVVGQITLQAEDAEDIAPELERYARKAGADWIVSFNEPKAVLLKDGWKVYRSTATLLHVLDADFVPQSLLAYSYYEDRPFSNYASLNDYYLAFGRGMANH